MIRYKPINILLIHGLGMLSIQSVTSRMYQRAGTSTNMNIPSGSGNTAGLQPNNHQYNHQIIIHDPTSPWFALRPHSPYTNNPNPLITKHSSTPSLFHPSHNQQHFIYKMRMTVPKVTYLKHVYIDKIKIVLSKS